MIRYLRLSLAALVVSVLGASTSSAFAQTFTLPEIGLQSSGACPQIAVRERAGNTMVPFGCVDNAAKIVRWSGDGSQISLTPSTSATSGTLSRLLANRAPMTDDGSVTAAGINARSTGQALIPYKPEWANTPGPERIRYQNLMELRTSRDGDSWESPLGIELHSSTGYSAPWQAGKVVAVGDNLEHDDGENFTYRVLKAGTLGNTPPSRTANGPNSAPFTDGTAQLQWINYANLAAKISLTNTTVAEGNPSRTWGYNQNFIMRAMNNMPKFMTGAEFDFENDSGHDCNLFSGKTCNSLTMFTGGPHISTSVISMSPLGAAPNFATEWGLSMKGAKLTRDTSIDINTGGQRAIAVGRNANIFGTATYVDSVFRDESAAPRAVSLGGTYSYSAINTEDANISADSFDVRPAIIVKAGQDICFAGKNSCLKFNPVTQRLQYKRDGATVMTIDGVGTIRSKGGYIQTNDPDGP